MNPAISQVIVGAQVALLLLAIVVGLAARSRGSAVVFAWINTVLALAAIALAGAAVAAKGAGPFTGEPLTWIIYGVVSFLAAGIAWGIVSWVTTRIRVSHEKHLQRPETRAALAEELRDVLRAEGLELDGRLKQAEADREQFLYTLEERHARQIAGLAAEYQHEAQAILRSLLDQLAVDQLRPMVDEQLTVQRVELERELGAIDADATGEALTKVRADHAALLEELAAAEQRVATVRADNPDLVIEDQVAARLAAVEATIDGRVEEIAAGFDSALEVRMGAVTGRIEDVGGEFDARIAQIGALLDDRVEAAGNPLAARLAETQDAVSAQLDAWTEVLDARFTETEQILNQRILEQEHALENRVVELEGAVEERLGQHVTALESVLGDHDEHLQSALADQSNVIGEHWAAERDRLLDELASHAASMQEQVAGELMAAEGRARETVEATQDAWNSFTGELEERFAETREEAMRAASEIAEQERVALQAQLEEITRGTSSDIAAKVEALGREAAWQRAQVDRTVEDAKTALLDQAKAALTDADGIFADLQRIGDERVDLIRRQAEDALVQSRDYVGQLQESLADHLEGLRERTGELAEEMNDRLVSITTTSQESAEQLERYAHELVAATTHELHSTAEQATSELQGRINGEFAAVVEAAVDQQIRGYEAHLQEVAQRLMQQVQGDLAGVAEHARTAVTGELDQLIAQSRDHARQAQEQAFMEVMNDVARQASELAEQARAAGGDARQVLENGLRDNRRQLEGAMASMGAHMREELVRFQDEGQRRVDAVIERLRGREQELLRDEDRRLTQARGELMNQHQGALEGQLRDMVGGLGRTIQGGQHAAPFASATGAPAGMPAGTPAGMPAGHFTAGVERPATPMQPGQGGFQG